MLILQCLDGCLATIFGLRFVAEILRLIEIFICLLSFLIISADLNIFIYAFLI